MTQNQIRSANADQLISDLVSDPTSFNATRLGNELLKYFLRGYSIDKLRTLLHAQNDSVVKTAVWIASELPGSAKDVLDDVIRLAVHPVREIRYFALDVIMLGTRYDRFEDFVHVVRCLEDHDSAVASHALFLLTRAAREQILAALALQDQLSPHSAGLRHMLEAQSLSPNVVERMLQGDNQVVRMYGLALAERLHDMHPDLLDIANNSADNLISSLASHLLRQHKIRKH
jgi:hypothetical protein